MDDAINSFNAVTGNEKLEVAKFYLDMVRGDVEQAIVAFMESGGAEPAADDTEEVDAELPDEDFQKPSDAKITTDSGKKDDEQRWYTGGGQGGSGQEVIAPGQPSNMAKDFIESVKHHGREGTSEDLETKKGAFSGSARTLDGQVIKPTKQLKKVVIKMYADGIFQLNDGSPKRMQDHIAMFESIRRQEVPPELEPRQDGGEVQISLMQIPREFDASKDVPKRRFQGAGHRLDENTASTSSPANVQQPITSWSGPDDSKPTTSIQIRMPDGSRLVGRFNLCQKIHEIRSFVAAARPTDKERNCQMLAGFPQKPVPDENLTIEEGGLNGSVVVFK